MSKQYSWPEIKKEFMTGDCNNLKKFAQKHGLPYNSNFKRMTRGWIQEREAKLAQIYSRKAENCMEKNVEEFVLLKKVFDESGAALFFMIDQFIKNRDCSKFALKQRKKGIVDIVEAPYIKINDVNKAVNALNKLYKILKTTYPTLSKLES